MKNNLLKDLKKSYSEDKRSFYMLFLYGLYALGTYELFNRPFGKVRNLKMPLDDMIPFIKELIVVYHMYMPMILLTAILVFVYDKKNYKRFIITLFVAQTLSYVIYMTYQTYVPRYDISLLGEDIFSKLVKMTYNVDNTYSGLPSMHVANMLLSSIFLSKVNIGKRKKYLLIAYMTLIGATTVLVKQHVIIDVPAGVLYAIATYVLTKFVMDIYENKEEAYRLV